MSDLLTTYIVAVFNCRSMGRKGQAGKNRPNAYLRNYSSDWRPCLHYVGARNGRDAKRMAIASHLSNTSCDQRDPHEVIGG